MGDIADDMVNGFMCSWCGTCFISEHGYPVLCKSCQEDTTIEEMEGCCLQPATLKNLGEYSIEEDADREMGIERDWKY